MKKVLALIATLVVATLAFAGCGGSQSSSSSSSSAAQTSGTKTPKVGATAVPHAEILEAAKPLLEKEGIKLDIVEFNDYVQPNLALNDKELDANYFQHEPYLKNFMDEHKEVKLKNAAGVHIEPMGIYSHKVKKLDELKDGASIAIPNDPTNGGRSLLLLEKAGLLKLKDGVGEKATVQDIVENPKNLKFQEVEAAQVPTGRPDGFDFAVCGGVIIEQHPVVPRGDNLAILDDDRAERSSVVIHYSFCGLFDGQLHIFSVRFVGVHMIVRFFRINVISTPINYKFFASSFPDRSAVCN